MGTEPKRAAAIIGLQKNASYKMNSLISPGRAFGKPPQALETATKWPTLVSQAAKAALQLCYRPCNRPKKPRMAEY
jgi:hypothetical protein